MVAWIRTNAVGLVIAMLLAANLVVQATEAKAQARAVSCNVTDGVTLANKLVPLLNTQVEDLIAKGTGANVAVVQLSDGASAGLRVMVCTW